MTDCEDNGQLSSLLPQVEELAREGGQEIMAIFDTVNLSVEYKQDHSPLTQADIASHHVISNGLAQLATGWPIISEEAEWASYEQRNIWQYFWLVDPMDGTKEFVRRTREFTVNIALIRNNVPVLGVVYAPALDKMYSAFKGGHACRHEGGVISQISTKPISGEAPRIIVSRSHEIICSRLRALMGDCEIVPVGSSLKFCLVAEGSADLYPRTGPTMEWDTAAGQCILEVAGGSVTDPHGNSLKYNKTGLRNPAFVACADSLPERKKIIRILVRD